MKPDAKQISSTEAPDAGGSALTVVRKEGRRPYVRRKEVRAGGQGEGSQAPRPIGRPPEPVPQDLADDLVSWLTLGKPLREWCRQPGNPEWRTVYHWMDKDPDFVARIARAREDGHDVIADECKELADTKPADQVEVAWRRLQVETRLKLLAKWNPKKYGDKVGVDHAGGVNLTVITGVPSADKP
jgi:hypothetical protein